MSTITTAQIMEVVVAYGDAMLEEQVRENDLLRFIDVLQEALPFTRTTEQAEKIRSYADTIAGRLAKQDEAECMVSINFMHKHFADVARSAA